MPMRDSRNRSSSKQQYLLNWYPRWIYGNIVANIEESRALRSQTKKELSGGNVSCIVVIVALNFRQEPRTVPSVARLHQTIPLHPPTHRTPLLSRERPRSMVRVPMATRRKKIPIPTTLRKSRHPHRHRHTYLLIHRLHLGAGAQALA